MRDFDPINFHNEDFLIGRGNIYTGKPLLKEADTLDLHALLDCK